MAVVYQQILALDVKYNAYRSPNNPQFSKFFATLVGQVSS